MKTNAENSGDKISLWGIGNWGGKILEMLDPVSAGRVNLVVVNSDMSALVRSPIRNKIPVGKKAAAGMGTGGDPLLGRKVFQEDEKTIREKLSETDILILTGGLGGGLGSGLIPAICRLAAELEIFTLVLASRPFRFEGKKKLNNFQRAADELADTPAGFGCFDLERLKGQLSDDPSIAEVYDHCDRILQEALESVISYLTNSFPPGGDRASLGGIFSSPGETILSRRRSTGSEGLVELTKETVTSLCLSPREFKEAGGVLIQIQSDRNIPFSEINNAVSVVAEYAGNEVDLLSTVGKREESQKSVGISILVSGVPERKETGHPSFPVTLIKDGSKGKQTIIDFKKMNARGGLQGTKPTICDGEDLDIPTWIRRGESLE